MCRYVYLYVHCMCIYIYIYIHTFICLCVYQSLAWIALEQTERILCGCIDVLGMVRRAMVVSIRMMLSRARSYHMVT